MSIKPLVLNGYKEVLLRAAQGRHPPPSTPPLLEAVVVHGAIHLECGCASLSTLFYVMEVPAELGRMTLR